MPGFSKSGYNSISFPLEMYSKICDAKLEPVNHIN